MVTKLLAVAVGLLLLLATPSSAVAVNLTSTATGTVFCNDEEVILTCETRGSDTLIWRGDSFYVGSQIDFLAELESINTSRSSLTNPSTVATLIQDYLDGDVRVLVSTLRISPLSDTPSGFVRCAHIDNTEKRIDFQVLDPPVVPVGITTFQLEHVQDMCAIASVLRSPTNPAEAAVTNYTVCVDGSSVPFRNAGFIPGNEMSHMHFTLVYELVCGAHTISITAGHICGVSPGAYEESLDADLRLKLNVDLPTCSSTASASNMKCSVHVTGVTVGVVLVALKYLLGLSFYTDGGDSHPTV